MHLVTSGSYPIPLPVGSRLAPHGVSDEAEVLRRSLEAVDNRLLAITQFFEDMQALVREHIQAEIDRIAAACNINGWNGEEGCHAVHQESANNAKAFVTMIDASQFPVPEVIPEPDGDLALEWHRDASRWLLISFGMNSRANYACHTGEGDRLTGTSRVTPVFVRAIEQQLALVYSK